MGKRSTKILELLTESGRMEVTKLAELMGVSQVTVRKDLDELERNGLAKREHGLAVIGSSDDISTRLAFHYEIKRKIAILALESIQQDETVMIESGSCCALLAEMIAHERRDAKIVTNSAFIAAFIRSAPNAKVSLLGGDYQPESQVMVGPLTRLCAEQYSVDKLFIGVDGYSMRLGFTGGDMMRADAVKAMARQAKHVVVLTESLKFHQQGVVSLMRADCVSDVYTDDSISDGMRAELTGYGIAIHEASK